MMTGGAGAEVVSGTEAAAGTVLAAPVWSANTVTKTMCVADIMVLAKTNVITTPNAKGGDQSECAGSWALITWRGSISRTNRGTGNDGEGQQFW